MVDNFALLVPHVLLVIAVWRIVQRDDLDCDPPEDETTPEPPRG